ncbi:MAG: hypothetical protein RIS53_880 [Bacillota bacterium]|jgi:hypothetical protein
MKSKLYKTHRKASYYRLRRLGYFSMSLMIATIIVVVPLTLAQASTTTSQVTSSITIDTSSSSQISSASEVTSSEESIEAEVALGGSEILMKMMMVNNS